MTTDTDTAAIRPPCDCIEDNAPCHHGPRYAVSADTAPLSGGDDDDLDRIGKLMDAIGAEADARRAELEDWKARATQAEAERDALRGDLSASQAREAGMREALTTIHELSSGYTAYDLRSATLRVMSIAQEAAAALSPAQPAQSADPLVTAYDNGVDHAWGVAKPLALAAEGVINWCDLALAHADRFDAHGVRNLTGPAFDMLRETVEAARSAGLLTTEKEVSNG